MPDGVVWMLGKKPSPYRSQRGAKELGRSRRTKETKCTSLKGTVALTGFTRCMPVCASRHLQTIGCGSSDKSDRQHSLLQEPLCEAPAFPLLDCRFVDLFAQLCVFYLDAVAGPGAEEFSSSDFLKMSADLEDPEQYCAYLDSFLGENINQPTLSII
uniref:Uncharacterized protein n=1 Tax=Sphaerodactylus townsendi TaxID=933632 RepID=A0ACB8F0E4_9SAUR